MGAKGGKGTSTNKKTAGLGKQLMKTRFKPDTFVNPDGSIRHTTDVNDTAATWTKFQSITQESDLESFLNTAQLAGTEFTAERLNVQVITDNLSKHTTLNEFLLDPEKEKSILIQHEEHKAKLKIPRRPKWDKNTTPEQLKLAERESFLDWRRNLAVVEENIGLLLTPYERNLEVWRQLWRVTERSDMIVQIVDARNPLLFRSTDVSLYVKELDERKKNLLLVNKADMLSEIQRLHWANYFIENEIEYRFFSAALAKKLQEEEKAQESTLDSTAPQRVAEVLMLKEAEEAIKKEQEETITTVNQEDENELLEADKLKIKILTVDELLELFMRECPKPLREKDTKSTIGFVGYPNVGKSSTLNALVGAKCVAVASTPGKTKHFQTIHLPPLPIILCDCPGLVFPTFVTTKADMVVNGILPIDQLRESTGPTALVANRIPKAVLEKVYGINIKTRNEEGLLIDRNPTAEEFLKSYAIARGYTKSSQGQPDESRAARYILKDYVNGKLLFSFAPPGIDNFAFNLETYQKFLDNPTRVSMVSSKILGQADLTLEREIALRGKENGTDSVSNTIENFNKMHSKSDLLHKTDLLQISLNSKPEVQALTSGKFATTNFTRATLFPNQTYLKNDATRVLSKKGKEIEGSQDRVLESMNRQVSTTMAKEKLHKKGKKNIKKRVNWTVDDS